MTDPRPLENIAKDLQKPAWANRRLSATRKEGWQSIRKVGEAQVCTSIIVAAELCYGARCRRGAQRTRLVAG